MRKYAWMLLAILVMAACGEKPTPETTPVTVTLSQTSVSFKDADSSTKMVSVTTAGNWTVSVSDTWIHVTPASGSGDGSFSITADDNTLEGARSGKITVTAGSASATVSVAQDGSGKVTLVANPAPFDGLKRSSTTYQLLIYSFADSDGDGIGDFKGIEKKLDYLDAMGVTALWLSPAHPTGSYHAYNVNDYYSLNPLYAVGGHTTEKAEQDFKDLIEAAHAKGIKIYMDYVLNHSGTGTEWFQSVAADPKNSPYRDYYVLSDGPYASEAIGGMGGWVSLGGENVGYKGRLHFKIDWNKKTVTVTESSDAVQSSNSSASLWLWIGSVGAVGLYETSTGVHEITINVDTDWGFLIRSSITTWDNNTKWGAKTGNNVVTFGTALPITASDPQDIVFGETVSYYASFDGSMPDLNYGNPDECEYSRAFQSTVESATQWINMGVDGFRLDAVVWVYNEHVRANQTFLDKWYKAVNEAYRFWHDEDIFMVGEAWKGHNEEKQYYKGLISNFEFEYFGAITNALKGSGSSFASTVAGYIKDHTAQRSDAITSIFLTNHDQARAAESLGKDPAKEKQAAAMLLTSGGKPFIYQGEELGYWGTQSNGDEYVRAPIVWDAAAKDVAKKGVNNKVDSNMLKGSISVETQSADPNSLLNVYQTWSRLRNTYPALAEGTMEPLSLSSMAAWYMSDGSQKLLVIHNVASSEKSVEVTDDMSKPVALLGSGTVKNKTLTLGANSSVVFEL